MDKFKFCIWLVDSLLRGSLSFHEIQHKWTFSMHNDKRRELTERTFNRYRRDAEHLFQVGITFSKSTGKYRIDQRDAIYDNKLLDWILSSYRLSNLGHEIKDKDLVQLEPPAPKSEYLEIILEAIETKAYLTFTYKSHYKEPSEVDFYPVFVRLCQQRWYVVGVNLKKEVTRVYAFERMSDLRITPYEDKPIVHKINPTDFFSYSYGVLNDEEPQCVKIRAFWPQNLYLKDVPLHSSQEIVGDTVDYTDFELYIRPTYDFIQALLAQREQIQVLEPDTLKDQMKETLTKMITMY